jgi:hypothetical protein
MRAPSGDQTGHSATPPPNVTRVTPVSRVRSSSQRSAFAGSCGSVRDTTASAARELIHAPQALSHEPGDDALIVAIVDTGVAANHPELEGKLRPGFDMINDVRELSVMPNFPPELVRESVELFKAKGLRRGVRVVGKQAAVAVGLEKTSKVFGLSAALAYSMEEAEKVLDGYTA